jgi:ABC-type transporter Mla subunit MlaD
MRRILSLLAIIAAVAAVLGAKAAASGSDRYTFDVLFDDAQGLVAGQVVKIAGAQAGTIEKLTVTSNEEARIQATITGPFRFHRDATCSIRPEGLISENYVECDPGSAGSPLLTSQHGLPPTVPVSHTSEDVTLQDLFNIFDVPTAERLQVLLDEFGIASAGEGDNVNSILNRVNPTLRLADHVIDILDSQTAQLRTFIDATNTIAAQGATHTAAVQAFLQRASALAALTADHHTPLALAIHRLPSLLSATRPALDQLDTVAIDGTPLLRDLQSASPSLDEANAKLGPFVKLAIPALAKVSQAVSQAIPTLRHATPVADELNTYTRRSAASTASFAKLSLNLVEHGFSENFFSVIYYVTGALSRYDSTSHLLSLLLVDPDHGACATYDSSAPIPGCSAHYGGAAAYTPQPDVRRATTRRHSRSNPRRSSTAGNASGSAASGAATTATSPSLAGAASGPATTVSTIASSAASRATSGSGQGSQALQNLVNYLFK